MKKLFVLALVVALALVIAIPSVAMAASPGSACVSGKTLTFNATGLPTSIDEGNVKALGTSGKWLVSDRHLKGTFVDGSDLSGDFTLTYGGIFKIADQSGNLMGTLKTDTASCLVVGDTQPISVIGLPYADADGDVVLPVLMSVSGKWTGVKGLNAEGTFQAAIVLAVYYDAASNTTGHVEAVLPEYNSITSAFVMTGKYSGRR